VVREIPLHATVTAIPGLLNITHVQNTGAAFGFLNSVDFPYKWLVAEGGTNDIYFDAATGAALWTTFQAWVEEAEAAGMQVVIITIPPRWGSSGWTADMETERLAFNTLALAYGVSHPSALVVNSDTSLGTGSPVALQASFDSGDALHLNGTGMQALAQAVYDLL